MVSTQSITQRLVAAYDRGTLVPFIGAGMSAPNCTLWSEFVAGLERQANLDGVDQRIALQHDEVTSLIQRGARAVRKLRQEQDRDLGAAVRAALMSAHLDLPGCPPGTTALAAIWWPMVITTNYDDWFYETWNQRWGGYRESREQIQRMEICGRGPSDCERVLNSLRAPDNPLLWAIQGFVGGVAPRHLCESQISESKRQELNQQLVIGHAEYRREAYRSMGFRRAFSEVFRSRSLLFLGSGLSEAYFASLFDEVLELQGAIPYMHYALVQRGAVDVRFLRDRFQIEAIEYEQHQEVPLWLDELHRSISERQGRLAAWGAQISRSVRSQAPPDMLVLRSSLPAPGAGECLLISAGVGQNRDPQFSESGWNAVTRHFPEAKLTDARLLSGGASGSSPGDRIPVWRFAALPVFGVAARDPHSWGRNARDARTVSDAICTALSAAASAGFITMHSMLLSAGRGRVFSPYVALIQMIRGYRRWKTLGDSDEFRLIIDVVDPGTLHLLASSRVNLSEIAASEEIRFWVEVWRSHSDVTRDVRFCAADAALRDVFREYDLPEKGWTVQVIPSPTNDDEALPIEDVLADSAEPWTVGSIGLLPGSTLRVFPS